jgi:outer membrane protein OmpA-like peptidoglycan-associated protein
VNTTYSWLRNWIGIALFTAVALAAFSATAVRAQNSTLVDPGIKVDLSVIDEGKRIPAPLYSGSSRGLQMPGASAPRSQLHVSTGERRLRFSLSKRSARTLNQANRNTSQISPHQRITLKRPQPRATKATPPVTEHANIPTLPKPESERLDQMQGTFAVTAPPKPETNVSLTPKSGSDGVKLTQEAPTNTAPSRTEAETPSPVSITGTAELASVGPLSPERVGPQEPDMDSATMESQRVGSVPKQTGAASFETPPLTQTSRQAEEAHMSGSAPPSAAKPLSTEPAAGVLEASEMSTAGGPQSEIASLQPATRTEQGSAAPREDTLTPENIVMIEFPGNETDLTSSGRNQLKNLSEQLRSREQLRLQLLAYADDDTLSPSKARRMSLSRALSVRSYLIENGIKTSRIDVRALGNKVTGSPRDRVDIKIVEQ